MANELVKVTVKKPHKKSLREILDEIEAATAKKVGAGYYQSCLAAQWGMWYSGKEVVAERGGGVSAISYRELEKQTGRDRESLKKWNELYERYPMKKLYSPIAEKAAQKQTAKWLKGSLVSQMTGNVENYTPKEVIARVRAVLGGIDLDPASCKLAQKLVKAETYYTKEDDGLSKPWKGRVFLNPPYGMPLIRQFTDKLIDELPNITAAILLTNDQTDTKWWAKCAANAALFCVPSRRLHFYTPEGKETSPTNGQTFFYYGKRAAKFKNVFSEIGLIMEVVA